MITTALDPPKTEERWQVRPNDADYVQLIYTVKKHGNGQANIHLADITNPNEHPAMNVFAAISVGVVEIHANLVTGSGTQGHKMGDILYADEDGSTRQPSPDAISVGIYGEKSQLNANAANNNYKVTIGPQHFTKLVGLTHHFFPPSDFNSK